MMSERLNVQTIKRQIPKLRRSYQTVLMLRGEMKRLYQELSLFGYAPSSHNFEIEVSGASAYVLKQRAALKAFTLVLNDELDNIKQLGCVIDDIRTGVFRWADRERSYQWRYGEDEVVLTC